MLITSPVKKLRHRLKERCPARLLLKNKTRAKRKARVYSHDVFVFAPALLPLALPPQTGGKPAVFRPPCPLSAGK